MNIDQRLLSADLRGFFLKVDYPIPFGLLDNCDVDKLPLDYKKIMADAFYRAWFAMYKKNGNCGLRFYLFERGKIYKTLYEQKYLLSIAETFEKMGYIRKIKRPKHWYEINANKFLNNRNM